jgi:putative transposase
MRELGLKCQSRPKRKQPAKVKKVTSAGYIYENLLKRDFSTTRLNEKWVADVTEIAVDDEKLFVSAIMDLYNNGIVGYQISQTHDVQLVEDSLFYALEIRKIEDSLILHTDQGMPYRSTRWKTLMDTFSIIPSMSRKANALDNACIESFFSYLKTEIQKELQTVKSIEDAKQLIHDYIRYYNHQRIQGALHYQTPIQYAQAS